MEHQWVIDAARVGIAALVLGYASVRDIRERRVPNLPWIILAVAAMILLPLQVVADHESYAYILVLVPVLAILADVYWDGKEDSLMERYGPPVKYALAIIAVVALGFLWGGRPYFQYLLAVPVMMMFVVLMYMADIIRGGADAKALISLAILFPTYPLLGGFPVLAGSTDAARLFFPFSFVILVNAAIMTALVAVAFFAKNAMAGDIRFPQAFLGYRTDVQDLKGRHVWLMERMENGAHKFYSRPKKEEDLEAEIGRLVNAGHTRVWITPKIPFIVPMLASLIFSMVVGNLIFLLTS